MFSITLLFILASCGGKNTKPDNNFDVSVSEPKLTNIKPIVLFDEAHKNHHQIKKTYKPFATLIANDDCIVKSSDKRIDKTQLASTDVFIIPTAMGKEDPGEKSPFDQHEVDALVQCRRWIFTFDYRTLSIWTCYVTCAQCFWC